MLNRLRIFAIFFTIFVSSGYAATIPGSVSDFKVSVKQVTISKKHVFKFKKAIFSWGKPSSYSGIVKYNFYITNPGGTQRKHKALISATSLSYVLKGEGTHKFEIEACNTAGQCGPRFFLTVPDVGSTSSIPGKVSQFTVSKTKVTEKETVTLSWGKPIGFSGNVKYNFYINKPGDVLWKYESLISSAVLTRLMKIIGTHKFSVEACNSVRKCGPRSSLNVSVSAQPISIPNIVR